MGCLPGHREGQGGRDGAFAQEEEEEEDENLLLPSSSPSSAFFDLDAILSHSACVRNGSRSAVSLSMHRSHSYFGPPQNDEGVPKEGRGSRSHPTPSTSGSKRTTSAAAARVHRLMGTACRSVSYSVSSLAPAPLTSIRPDCSEGSPSSVSLPWRRSVWESAVEERHHTHEETCGTGRASSFPHHENAATSAPEPTGIVGGGPSHHSPSSSSSSSSVFVPDYRSQSYCVASVLHSGARSREVGVALCHFPSMVFSLTQFSDGLTYNKLLSFLNAKDPVEVVLPFASNVSSSSSHFIPTLLQHLPEDTTCTALPRSLFHSERGVQLIMELQSSALGHATSTGADGAPPFSAPWNNGNCGPTVDTAAKKEENGQTRPSCPTGMRLSTQFLEQEASDRYLCVAAAHALMQYLQSLQNCRWPPHSLCIRYEELEQYMEMSRATARALHLIPSSSVASFFSSHCTKRVGHSATGHPSRVNGCSRTLIDVLPPACTMMGQRFLRGALLQPLRESYAIACRQDVVEWLLRPPYRLMALRQCLQGGEGGGGGGLAHTDLERLCAELLVVWDPTARDGDDAFSTSCRHDERDAKARRDPLWVDTPKTKRGKAVDQTPSPLPCDDRSVVLSTFEMHLRKVQQLHDYWETLNGCQDFFLLLGRLLGFHKDEAGEEAEQEETGDGVCGVPRSTAISMHTGTARPSSTSTSSIPPNDLSSASAECPPSLIGHTSTPEKPLLLHQVFYTLQACPIASLLDVLKEYLDESILRSHSSTTTTAAPSFHTAPPAPYPRRYPARGGGKGRSGREGNRRGLPYASYYRGAAPRQWNRPHGSNGTARHPPSWSYGGGARAGRGPPSRPVLPRVSGTPDGLKANIFRLLRLSFMIRAHSFPATPTSPLQVLPLYRQRLSMLLGKISQHTESLQRQYGLTTLRLEPDHPCSAWRGRGRVGGGERRTCVVSLNRKRIARAQRLYRFSFGASEIHKVKHIQFTFMYGVGRSHLTAALEMWRRTHSRAPSPSSLSSSSSTSTSSSSSSDTSSEDDEEEEEEEEEERPPQKKRHCVSTPRTAVAALSSSRGAAAPHRDASRSVAAGRSPTGRPPAFGVPKKPHRPNTRIRCSTEALDDLCVEVHECLAYIFAEEVRLARPLLDRLQHHVGHLQAMGESIALVDTLMSFAVYAATQQGRRPTLLEPTSSSTTTTTLPHVSFYHSRPPCMVSTAGNAYRAGDLLPPSWALPGSAKDGAAPLSLPLPRSEAENEDEEGGEMRRRWRGKATWAPPPPPPFTMDAPRAGRSAFPVANTVEWEEGVPLVVVTGPNMSGKTTLLRQVGQLQVLAQSGCFLPVGDDREAGEASRPSTGENREMRGEKDNGRQEGTSFSPSSSPFRTQKTQIALVHRLMAHLLCDDLPSATLSTFKKELLLLGEVTEAIAVDCGMPADMRGTDGEEQCTTGPHPGGVREKEEHKEEEERGGMTPAPSAGCALNASAAVEETPSFPFGKSSLILIDELGRSTNTREGFALAWAFGRFVCELPLSLWPTSSTPAGCAACTTVGERASRAWTHTKKEVVDIASPCVGCPTRPPPIRVLLTTHFEGLTGLCHLYPQAVRHHHFAFTTTTTTTITSQHSVTHDLSPPPPPSPYTMKKDAPRTLPARSAPRRTLFSTSHQLCSGPCPSSHGVHYGLALAKRLQLLPEVVDMAYQLSALEEQAAGALAAEEAAIQTSRIGVGGKVEGVALAKSTDEERRGHILPEDA